MSRTRWCSLKTSFRRANGAGVNVSSILWTIMAIVILLTLCYTADLLHHDPASVIIVVLVWVCVVAGMVVVYLAESYWMGKPLDGWGMTTRHPPLAYSQPPGWYHGPPGRPCRYCDGLLFAHSPICPKCGRRN